MLLFCLKNSIYDFYVLKSSQYVFIDHLNKLRVTSHILR